MKIRVGVGLAIAVLTSGCSMGWTVGEGLALAGSPEALEAFYEGQNSLITNAKTEDPNGNSAAWDSRNLREQERTKRKVPVSFWSKMNSQKEGS